MFRRLIASQCAVAAQRSRGVQPHFNQVPVRGGKGVRLGVLGFTAVLVAPPASVRHGATCHWPSASNVIAQRQHQQACFNDRTSAQSPSRPKMSCRMPRISGRAHLPHAACRMSAFKLSRSLATTRSAASTSVSASQAAEQLSQQFQGKTNVRRQILDANQLQKLSLTLGRRELGGTDISDSPPVTGTPIPPGWHLVYFTPDGLESELGPDGTDRTFNSPAPFTRRMWAGGRMAWPGARYDPTTLRVGDEVEERTKFVAATAKANRFGQEMVLVEVEKELWGPRGLGVVDQRSVGAYVSEDIQTDATIGRGFSDRGCRPLLLRPRSWSLPTRWPHRS